MAEVLWREAFGHMQVSSAGIGALVGHGADAHAIRLMAARGLDLEKHRAQAFTGQMGIGHDLILTMSMDQRTYVEERWRLLQGRVFTFGYFDNTDIDDPYRMGEAAFREAMDGIDRGIEQWKTHLGTP